MSSAEFAQNPFLPPYTSPLRETGAEIIKAQVLGNLKPARDFFDFTAARLEDVIHDWLPDTRDSHMAHKLPGVYAELNCAPLYRRLAELDVEPGQFIRFRRTFGGGQRYIVDFFKYGLEKPDNVAAYNNKAGHRADHPNPSLEGAVAVLKSMTRKDHGYRFNHGGNTEDFYRGYLTSADAVPSVTIELIRALNGQPVGLVESGPFKKDPKIHEIAVTIDPSARKNELALRSLWDMAGYKARTGVESLYALVEGENIPIQRVLAKMKYGATGQTPWKNITYKTVGETDEFDNMCYNMDGGYIEDLDREYMIDLKPNPNH